MIRTIRAKIIFTFAGIVVLNLGAGFWSIYNFYKLGTTVATIVRENYNSVIAAENMVKSLERQDNALILAGEGEEASVAYFSENKELFLYWFGRAVRSLALPGQEPILDSIQAVYQRYALAGDHMLAMISQGALRDAQRFYDREVRRESDALRNLFFQLFELNQVSMYSAEARTHSFANQSAFGTLIASIVTLALSILGTAWLTRYVITPAEQLTDTVRQIGKGKLDLKIDVLSNDEIGQLSREFNKMTERLHRFEQMNIEQILSEKRKSEAIVESITDGLVVTDRRGAVVHINGVVGDMFSVSPDQAIGAPVESVLRDSRILAVLRDFETGASQGGGKSPQVFQIDHRGTVTYYRPRMTRLVDTGGLPAGVLLLLQDVTQFKELDRMKSDFIATLSHEFRTPVTSINMSVDILSRGILGPLNERQRELIDSAKQDCARLTKLARELLQLSKLESGRLPLREEELDIAAMIEQSIRSLQLQFDEKQVRLVPDVEPGLPRLVADEEQIASVITNLVSNALKHTRAGGRVTVRARASGENLRVEVEDTGRGIPREHLDDIFDKFVQVKRASEATPGSVGLGLAIAKEVVQLYGGRIWAESEQEKGSTFSFELPLGKARVSQEAERR